MQIKDKDDQYMHSRLPISKDEQILAIYKHHWFAYASLWLMGLVIIAVIMGIAALVVFVTGSDNSSVNSNKTLIFGLATIVSAVVGLFTFIPVYLKSQEQVVLTEEALLQILQPSLFASKISQLNLQHINDVSVRQDIFGTILGYGKISVETPGEQDNYEFFMIPNPNKAAREVIDAHENYQAAVEAGRIPSTLGDQQAAPAIDPQQYEQFLEFQKMAAAQQQTQQPAQTPPSSPPAGAEPAQPAAPQDQNSQQ
jgi:uncharacterized membrane protein YdbT with pleckstrin-like domain